MKQAPRVLFTKSGIPTGKSVWLWLVSAVTATPPLPLLLEGLTLGFSEAALTIGISGPVL